MRQGGPVDPRGAEGVDVEQIDHLLGGVGLGVAEGQVAGVVDHDVEPSRLVDDGRNSGVGRLLRADVHVDHAYLEALTPAESEQLARSGPVATGQVQHAGLHGVAGGCEGTGGEVADATGGAGDEDD